MPMGIHDERSEGRGLNFFTSDQNLQSTLKRLLSDQDYARSLPLLLRLGELAGGPIDVQAEYTDRLARPVLETYDRQGNVVNGVRYNPLYEESVRQVYELGIVGCNYGEAPLPYVAHYALIYLLSQSDPGLACPVTLTAAAAFVLARHGSAAQKSRYLPGLTVRTEGPFLDGATWVTEKQGGSDAGAAETRAEEIPAGEVSSALAAYGETDRPLVRLYGEKWFASNADADVALVTARPPGAEDGTRGLGLYLMPRRLADGSMNRYRIRRLKDKLGTTGLATGEIELDGTLAELVAPPPVGFKHMLEALEFSRIANAAASAGIHRRAFLEAKLYARQRIAFGRPLDSMPMVQETLVTMLAELEAAQALSFAAATALDAAARPDDETLGWHRLTTAVAKYWTGEAAVRNASRAIEVLGGNGYVEEYVTARMYREAQVLPVWEGPANIQALELLRTLGPRLRADRLLLRRLRAVAQAAQTAEEAKDLGRLLQHALEEMEQTLAPLRDNPEESARYGRRLLDYLSPILAFALLLEEAHSALDQGDRRKLVLTWWFAHLHLAPPRHLGVGMDLRWLGHAYRALIDEEPLGRIDLPPLSREVSLR